MNKDEARQVGEALETLYTICRREQKKKQKSVRCVGCPAHSTTGLCPYANMSSNAPWRWYIRGMGYDEH